MPAELPPLRFDAAIRADAFEQEVTASVAGHDGALLATISRRVEGLHGRPSAVVVVNGDIDIETAPLLEVALLQAVEAWPQAYCDLDGVTFFGAVGVNVLLTAQQRAQAVGHRFAVRGVGATTRRVLAVFGLDQTIAGVA